MKQIVICVALSIGLLIPSVANGAETSGTLPSDPNTLTQYHMDKYGDSFEISWTTNFKKTGKCKSAQIQFISKRFLSAPEERSGGNGFYFYSADFKSILQAEGMYSKKLENKGSRFVFDFFLLDGDGKGGKSPADVISKCLALTKNFKSPLQIYYYNSGGKAPYEGELIAAIPFKVKK
jgi:hypothetical protein